MTNFRYLTNISICSPKIGPAKFRAPEVLFRPDLIGEEYEGIHEVLAYSIRKSDMDLRRMLFSNVVLSGGSTLFKSKSFEYLRDCQSSVQVKEKVQLKIHV